MSLCEYDPKRKQPALSVMDGGESMAGCMNEATVSIGAAGMWHLCASCAELPEFARFKKRTPLKRPVRPQGWEALWGETACDG